jgi:hypothetical protein
MSRLQPALAARAPAASTPLQSIFLRLLGPDTTAPEARLAFAGALGLTGLAAVAGVMRAPGWSVLQWVLAIGIAFDFGGGVVGNATRSAARWFHRPGQGRSRALFFLGHVHPVALALFFGTPWAQAVALYIGMLAAAALVELSPRAIARPFSFGLVTLGLVLAGWVAWPAGFEWFAPVYLLKLVGGHAVPPDE